jgi:hypothetical protein
MTRYLLFLDCYGLVSDEGMGLPFIYAAGPCQRSVSRVLVPWGLRPYFNVSHLRLPFSSPPTTRRVTVEVFDPASTRVLILRITVSRLGANPQKTSSLNYSSIVGHCRGNVLTEQLPSNGCLLWLHHSGFQASRHNIFSDVFNSSEYIASNDTTSK